MCKPLMKVLLLFASLLLVQSPCLAAEEEIHGETGVDPFRLPFSSAPGEAIDPFTGGLTLVHEDLRLPGDGGLDLVLNRVYNSKKIVNNQNLPEQVDNPYDDYRFETTVLGMGWDMHLGRVWVGVTSAVFEMGDGSTLIAYADSNVAGNPYYTSQDFSTYNNQVQNIDGQQVRVLKTSDGREIYFSALQFQADGYYYATKIKKGGSEINIAYYTDDTFPARINTVTDSTGRTVTFSYINVDGSPRLSKIECSEINYSVTYSYNLEQNQQPLNKVTLPEGKIWQYGYTVSSESKFRPELTSLILPHGGQVTYYFDFFEKDTATYLNNSFRAVSRKIQSGAGVTSGNWTFDYTPNDNEPTIVRDTVGGYEFRFNHYDYDYNFSNGYCYLFGKIRSKSIFKDDKELMRVDYTWGILDDMLSPFAISIPGLICGLEQVSIPVIEQEKVTFFYDDGTTSVHTTTYSDFDQYGNSRLVDEAHDAWTRHSDIDYWYNDDPYIVKEHPATETVTGSLAGTSTTSYQYYSTDGLLQSRSDNGVVTSYTYYGNGNLNTETDADSNITEYVWQNGRQKTITNPIYAINRVINRNGTIASETNGRLYTTGFSYDGLMRLTQITPPAGEVTAVSYSADLRMKTEKRGGFIVETTYDGLGRKIAERNQLNISSTTHYNAAGFVDYVDSNVGDKVSYDILGRKTLITHKDNETISYTFSKNKTTVKDENDAPTQLSYLSFGDPNEKYLIKVTDAKLNDTDYSYNIVGKPTGVTQGDVSRSYGYNEKFFLAEETHPETGRTAYPIHDGVGNVKRKIDSRGVVTDYVYDGLHRLRSTVASGAVVQYTFDDADNLTKAESPDAILEFTYDKIDRLTERKQNVGGQTYITGFAYDGDSNLINITYPVTGNVVAYDYNSVNQVISVTGFGGTVSQITYHTTVPRIGLLKSFKYSNGLYTTLNYTSRNLLNSMTVSDNTLDRSYIYDTRGNLGTITDNLGEIAQKSFGYDSLNRLTSFSGPWGSGSYDYDRWGNRKFKTVAGTTENYVYDSGTNRLDTVGSLSYAYNNSGDVTGIGSDKELHYDTFRNLTGYEIGGSDVASYAYDAHGQRVKKSSSLLQYDLVYHYDLDGNVIAETSFQGHALKEYVYLAGKLIARIGIDSDQDGLEDAIELNSNLTDPSNPDSDGDGLLDGIEDINHNGIVDEDESSPKLPDTDYDELGDAVEDANMNGLRDPFETSPAKADTDEDGLSDYAEYGQCSLGYDADTDDDGITDGDEYLLGTAPCNADTDGDGLQDGMEIGLTLNDIDSDYTDVNFFQADADPSTVTNPLDSDTDGDGLLDGIEDSNHNGMVDGYETNPDFFNGFDTDGDGLFDDLENEICTLFNDADTDDDGIVDGNEDVNRNGTLDYPETDPCNADTDGDGMQDGYELGYTLDMVGPDTVLSVFTPDDDPTTITDPLVNIPAVISIINSILLN